MNDKMNITLEVPQYRGSIPLLECNGHSLNDTYWLSREIAC